MEYICTPAPMFLVAAFHSSTLPYRVVLSHHSQGLIVIVCDPVQIFLESASCTLNKELGCQPVVFVVYNVVITLHYMFCAKLDGTAMQKVRVREINAMQVRQGPGLQEAGMGKEKWRNIEYRTKDV